MKALHCSKASVLKCLYVVEYCDITRPDLLDILYVSQNVFHKGLSLTNKIDRNPGELLLGNFQVCWVAESLFGGREMQQWNGS